MLYYLLIESGRIVESIAFPKVIAQCEMHTTWHANHMELNILTNEQFYKSQTDYNILLEI